MKNFGALLYYFLIEYLSFWDGSEQTRIDNIIRLHTAMQTTAAKAAVYHAVLTLFLYLPVMIAIFTNKKKIERCRVYILSRTSNRKYMGILLKENFIILARLIGIKVIVEFAICFEEIIIEPSTIKTMIEYNFLFTICLALITIVSELIRAIINISYKIIFAISMLALFLSYFFSGNDIWWDKWITPIGQGTENRYYEIVMIRVIYIVIICLLIKIIDRCEKKDIGLT